MISARIIFVYTQLDSHQFLLMFSIDLCSFHGIMKPMPFAQPARTELCSTWNFAIITGASKFYFILSVMYRPTSYWKDLRNGDHNFMTWFLVSIKYFCWIILWQNVKIFFRMELLYQNFGGVKAILILQNINHIQVLICFTKYENRFNR